MDKKLLSLKRHKGFTLIELIITMAIISIISIPMMTFFISNYSIYFKETSKMDAMQVAQAGINRVITDMRRAEQTTIIKNNDSSLQMFITTTNSDGVTTRDKYEYLLQDNTVYQRANDGTKNQLMSNVEAFNIDSSADTESTIITIKVIIKSTGKDGYKFELSNSHKIRN